VYCGWCSRPCPTAKTKLQRATAPAAAPNTLHGGDGATAERLLPTAGPSAFHGQKENEGEALSETRLSGGLLATAISNAVVHRMAEVSGRGPSRARTTLGHNTIFVVVEDTLTRAERELVRIGDQELVLRLREGLQRAMHESLDSDIERLTGQPVIGFMSTNNIDPDLAVEVFILGPGDANGASGNGASGTSSPE